MSRKTIEVSFIKNRINNMLLQTADDMVKERRISMTILESVLHESGNYKGFSYLSKMNMEKSLNGSTVGINDADTYEGKFVGTDNTRVYYF